MSTAVSLFLSLFWYSIVLVVSYLSQVKYSVRFYFLESKRFRPNIGTIDAVFITREILEKAKEHNVDMIST